jgi:hypothetical protein
VAVCAIVGLLSSATAAHAQVDFGTPAGEALSAAVKASPELVQGLAKELGSTPEQAAGAAGLLFGIAKSLLKPGDFAAMSKAVPGMEALLAAVPPGVAGTSGEPAAVLGSTLTPGFASSSASTLATAMAPQNGMASAVSGFSKLGIKPEMIAKAVPFLSGYLKKYGGGSVGGLLGGLFGTAK